LVASAAAWARRQEWVNGRFVEVDYATGEILSEHKHTPFRELEPSAASRPFLGPTLAKLATSSA
jgi:hypothetical protein